MAARERTGDEKKSRKPKRTRIFRRETNSGARNSAIDNNHTVNYYVLAAGFFFGLCTAYILHYFYTCYIKSVHAYVCTELGHALLQLYAYQHQTKPGPRL